MAAKGKRLEIVLDGVPAGQLFQDEHGRLSLVYDDYRRRADAHPLSLSMPLSLARYEHNSVDPFLRGLLPDSEAVLQRWGRRFGVSANSLFALLSHMTPNRVHPISAIRRQRVGGLSRCGWYTRRRRQGRVAP